MSQVIFHDVLALEVHRREGNKKNDSTGKWEKTGVFYHNLILWQFGNERPAPIIASLSDAQIEKAKPLAGKMIDVSLDMKITETGAKFSFIDIIPKTAKAA